MKGPQSTLYDLSSGQICLSFHDGGRTYSKGSAKRKRNTHPFSRAKGPVVLGKFFTITSIVPFGIHTPEFRESCSNC